MGRVGNIRQIRVWVGETGASDWDGVYVYVSEDAITWGDPVIVLVSLAGYNEWSAGDIDNKDGRYIKLEHIETRHGGELLQGYEFEAFIR
jgi:hypothetical protein